jgi:hypothetical protein
MDPLTEHLQRKAAKLARTQAPGAPKELRIARAKRQFEFELRAQGLSRSAAKTATSVRFGPRKQ